MLSAPPTRRRALWGLAGCVLLLLAAEGGTRGLEAAGLIPPASSLDGLVNGRLEEMAGVEMDHDLWLLGNSTLAEGLDADLVAEAVGERSWSLPHGSATVAASAALAEMYLKRLDEPERLVFFSTVDDFNRAGLRAERSWSYLTYRPKPVPLARQYIQLIGNGPRVRQFLVGLAVSMLKGKFNLDFVIHKGKGTYDGRPIPERDGNHDRLFRSFDPDFEVLDTLAKLSREHGLPAPVLVLLPVTTPHIQFRESFLPGWSYSEFREKLTLAAREAGVLFVDFGEPSDNFSEFRDTYHLNDVGMEHWSPLIGEAIADVIQKDQHGPASALR